MKNKKIFLISVLLIFALSGICLADSLKTKMTHFYITITKIEISKDGGSTWIKAYEGNQVQDLVEISGKNVLVFSPAWGKISEGTYNRARTSISYVKLEFLVDDGVHGAKKVVLDDPTILDKKYPIVDEREINVNVPRKDSFSYPRGTFKFDAQNSYSLKAVWDPKINDYKITAIEFEPIITVK